MIFEDYKGRILLSEDVDKLSLFQIESLKLHVFEEEENKYWF